MLSLSFWVTLLFSILFAMAAMDVTGQCYVDPCSAASPAITSGLSLVTALAAFLFIAQVFSIEFLGVGGVRINIRDETPFL